MEFGRNKPQLVGFVYLDFVGDHDKRRFLMGYLFSIGGCAVS